MRHGFNSGRSGGLVPRVARWLVGLAVLLATSSHAESMPAASPPGRPGTDSLSAAVLGHARIAAALYAEAVTGAEHLRDAVNDMLAHPSRETLARAREAWIACRDPYGRTEALRFSGGPIDDIHPLTHVEGPETRINSWPIDEAFLDYVHGQPHSGLISDRTVTLDEATLLLRNAAADDAQVTLGYHAIEFLLWGQDRSLEGPGERPHTDFLPGRLDRDRRRTCLRLLVELVLRDLSSVAAEWDPARQGYAGVFLAMRPEDALGRALSGPATLAAFELASERIGVPLSSGLQEDEQSCFSDNTHRDIAAGVDGIGRVLEGDTSNPGLLTALARADRADIRDRLARARRLAHDITPPFDAVLASPEHDPRRRTLQALAGELFGLAGAIQRAGVAAGAHVRIGGG